MRQIVIDTETTGLEPEQGHRIVEIAAVELIDNEITGATFHRYCNPDRSMDSGAAAVTGLTAKFLGQQPRFAEIAGSFVEFIRGAELLVHNAPFDLTFIGAELKCLPVALSLSTICPNVIDTLPLARRLHPGQRNSLDALCNRYRVDRTRTKHVGALLDATLLAEVYLAGFASLRIDLAPQAPEATTIWTPDMDRELFAHLRRNPRAVFELSPRRFEELIASIFRNNGFSVELTPATRDGGMDIIAVERSALTGSSVHLIECKRYHPSKSVGIGVVQRLLGTVTERRATKGIVVATSFFTRDAIRVAEETRHVIALNDYKAIVGWLSSHGDSHDPSNNEA